MTPATGYHAHFYWTGTEQQALADHLCTQLVSRFGAVPGTRHESAGGPHPTAEIHAGFGLEAFGSLVPWLMMNRAGLSVLVHPQTDDALADHTTHALWLGSPLAILTDAL